MSIPGGNLLNTAFRAIARQQFMYVAVSSRTPQPNGDYVANYFPPVSCTGSAQPMPREFYQQYGLDFESKYFNFFLARHTLDVTRDVSGDQVIFQGKYYQVLSRTPWYGIDGWDQILTVEVPNPNA